MEATGNNVEFPPPRSLVTEVQETAAPSDLPTIVHRLQWHGTTAYGQYPAFTMILDEQWAEAKFSFRQLDQRARGIAKRIEELGGSGERVLIVLDPGLDYVASLFGCMYAGAIAVPVYPPSMLRLQHTLSRLQAIIHDANAALMLTSADVRGDKLSPLWNMEHDAAIVVEEVPSVSNWDRYQPDPSDVAILQYTSGSTGIPRGVALTHANLMHNLRSLVDRFHFLGAKALHWIPPYHDMGLVGGILLPSYQGVEAIFMQPKDFISNPIHWLRAFDRYRATSTGCPNFGYELCVRKIKPEDCEGLDLSSWKIAVTGAEPVRASTIKRFTEKFAPFGFQPQSFCPALGMAESTVIISGSPLGEHPKMFEVDSQRLAQGELSITKAPGPRTQTLVSSGRAIPDTDIEIVDPDSRYRSPQGQIGEIWTRGPSVALGYWNQPEKTRETFNGVLADTDESGYLRTGDLGCMVGDELIVTGRRKELIIIAGRNYYPHDIEAAVQATSEAFKADAGVAFSIDHGDAEQLVVVQEVWRPNKFDLEELLQGSLSAVAEAFEVTPAAIVLVKSGSLPKTSSGKLRRRDVRDLFLARELAEKIRWEAGETRTEGSQPEYEPPQTETEEKLAKLWQQLLAVDRIGRNDDFFILGGQSLLVSQLIAQVSERLDVEVSFSTLFANSRLREFAVAIDQSRTSAKSSGVSLQRVDRETYPLSSAQQRFWVLHELEQVDAFLHVPVSITLKGDLDVGLLQDELNRVCQNHPALRTAFDTEDGVPYQKVLPSVELPLLDFRDSGRTIETIQKELREGMFDLQSPPLVRAALLRTDETEHLELVFHHLVCDAASVELFLEDLTTGQDTQGGLRYVDFASWEQANPTAVGDPKLQYWIERLEGIPQNLRLPSDPQSDRGMVEIALTSEMSRQIGALALQRGATASMLYLAAYQYTLSRYSGSADLPIAMPTTDRSSSEFDSVIGCFMNPMVFRGKIQEGDSFLDLLERTRDALLQDIDHAGVPFQDVAMALGHERDLSKMPLAQNMFLFQAEARSFETLAGAEISVRPDYSMVTAYDLSLVIHPSDTVRIVAVSGRGVSQRAVEQFLELYQETLRSVILNPTIALASLPSQSTTDRNTIERWNRTRRPTTSPSVLHRISEHALGCPDRVAISDDHLSISYQELDQRSSSFAQLIRQHGIADQSLIGISTSRTIDMVVAMLGIWKARCAYVPLDPELPVERLQLMIEDADLAAVICDRDAKETWDLDIVLTVDESAKCRGDAFDLSDACDGLAYVIYTSGSTGVPKGVAIEHPSVANLLDSFAANPGFCETDTILALTTTSFDISVLELFLPLWVGGHVRLTQLRAAKEPEAMAALMDRESITHLQTTPSVLRILLSSGWKPSQALTVMSGGEPLLKDLASKVLEHGSTLWNVYGPTETTVWSTATQITSERFSIGQPIVNTQTFVLDHKGHAVPIGCGGELYIGGRGLARGYWNRPDLTEQRFAPASPLGPEPPSLSNG